VLTLVEILVVTFIVAAFVAIVLRFTPRDARGAAGLPAVIDESVGMDVLRRLAGRRRQSFDGAREADRKRALEAADLAATPGSPAPTLPTRFVVSRRSSGPQPVAGRAPSAHVVARKYATGSSRPRPTSALALQRRIAGVVATTVLAIALVGVALVPREPNGAVLSATGTPAPSATVGPTTSISPPPVSGSP
jgi:hypothetical protein